MRTRFVNIEVNHSPVRKLPLHFLCEFKADCRKALPVEIRLLIKVNSVELDHVIAIIDLLPVHETSLQVIVDRKLVMVDGAMFAIPGSFAAVVTANLDISVIRERYVVVFWTIVVGHFHPLSAYDAPCFDRRVKDGGLIT